MLDIFERRIVEQIRSARSIKIVVNEGWDNELEVVPKRKSDITKLTHDVAIAVQGFFNAERAKQDEQTKIL